MKHMYTYLSPYVYVCIYQKFFTIFFDSAGAKNQKLRGTNYFTLLFSPKSGGTT